MQVLSALVSLASSGELWPHLGTSALEFALGYAIASILGIAIGLLIATSSF
jgi:ABC-type nitrate/sulfonate/bicarbonate transport system permease component